MTIWVFGDSYVEERGVDWQWFKQLGKLMNEPVIALGESGVNNDFITHQIYLHLEQEKIHKDDWVIQVHTQYSRQWFFKDRPKLSNFVHHTDPTVLGMTRDEKRAADSWIKYLYNPECLRWQTYANSLAMHTAVNWLSGGARSLIIPGFHNGFFPFNPHIGVKGTLTECVSYLETADLAEYEKMLTQDGGDPRVNHMSQTNHSILAQKIADSRTTGELNLLKGFDIQRTLTRDDFESDQGFQEYLVENSN